MFSSDDLRQIVSKGISEQAIEEQIEVFKRGIPFLKVDRTASIGDGILSLSSEDKAKFTEAWEAYLSKSGYKIVKFVPASGAASRMFKDLFEFMDNETRLRSVGEFFHQIEAFAFYEKLDETCQKLYNKSVEAMMLDGDFAKVLEFLLKEEGLNYVNLPKGLLLFHRYYSECRTPFLEHLVEGVEYAKNSEGEVNLHFTVSPAHKELFTKHLQENIERYSQRYGVKFYVDFSEQKSSTDTIAVDSQNEPFREADGSLVLRPGGHGALIENLNDLKADVVFVKNIDNVATDSYKAETVEYKKLLAGILVSLQEQVFSFLRELENEDISEAKLQVIVKFLQSRLSFCMPDIAMFDRKELRKYLICKLNRPIRVCGMVRNEGEPGGGPFWVMNDDGSLSLQILESSQIDVSDATQRDLMNTATHFNPVDLVCGIKDYRGEKFDLQKFVDKNTYFISSKSKNGKELKALELPGLWNGAMSDWLTVFVEVPLETFTPVKTVNDLLRPQHQK